MAQAEIVIEYVVPVPLASHDRANLSQNLPAVWLAEEQPSDRT
jgi:hypothetical protein